MILPLPDLLLRHHLEALSPLLKHWHATQKLPHALALIGTDGVGKRSIAHFLARWIFCDHPNTHPSDNPSDLPCGKCSTCTKTQWLDFTEVLSLTEDGTPAAIKLEHIAGLIESLSRSPFESRHRVIVINHADQMNMATANSLLKVLEEPPPQIIFILTSSARSTLLPTLLSRCQAIQLRPLSAVTLTSILKSQELAPDRIQFASDAAQGSLGRAHRLASDLAFETQQKIVQFLKNPSNEMSGLLDWATSQPLKSNLTLDILEFFLSKRLIENPNLVPTLERIQKARSELLLPVNKKILFQDVLSRLF